MRFGASRATWFRAAAAAAAAVAAWGPESPGARAPVLRVLLADVSASVGTGVPRDEDLALLRDGLAARDRVAVVAFAESALVTVPPTRAEDPVRADAARPGRWGTSAAAALRTAASLRGPGERLEILLVTDARLTDDEAGLAAAAAAVRRSGGASLRTVAVPSAPQRASVRSLRGPGRAIAGESFALDASGVAGVHGATVELVGGGAVLERRAVGRPGPFRVVFTRTADAAGLRSWEARTSESPDVPAAAARVVVAEPGSAVLLHDGAVRPGLAAAAGRLSATVDVVRAPGDVAAAAVGAEVVVVDAPGFDVRELAAWVRAGGGLLLLGGGPPQDAVSPLRTTPPEERGAVVYLAIDGSGSMGEPWPGTAGGLPRDAAVRSAADSLVRAAPDGTLLLLRRFRETLVPDSAPSALELGPSGRGDAARAVHDLPAPGGSTAFLPVLREALDVLAGRAEPVRAAILLTDGRSAEPAEDVAASVARLTAAGVRVAIVVPGAAGPDEVRGAPLLAAAGTAVPVFAASEPGRLRDALAAAAASVRGGDEPIRDAALEATGLAAGIVGPGDVPPRAASLRRRFAAPDATVLVRTTDGHPAAAVRSEGAGAVAALAVRAPDASVLDGDHGAALVRALVRAVRRRGSAALRAEASGDVLRLRVTPEPGRSPPVAVRYLRRGDPVGRSPLRPAGPELFEADGPGAADADSVVVEDAAGAEVAAAGIDRPAPREAGDVPVADLGAIAARLAPADGEAPAPVRAPFAAAALAFLILGSVKSRSRPAR